MASPAMFVATMCSASFRLCLQAIMYVACTSPWWKKLSKRLLSHPGIFLLAAFTIVILFLELIGHISLAGIHRRFFGLELPRAECVTGPKFNLTVMTVFKDTAPYLKEWLEFHLMLGVECFYLYDNNSTDKPLAVLRPYILTGTVVYRFWPNHFHIDFDGSEENYSQKSALENALLTYRCDSRWMALIDTDEFLMPGENYMGHSLPSLLERYKDHGGVAVAWLRFGTNGHSHPPAKLVTEAYTRRRALPDPHFKNIVQPRYLRGFMNIHEMFFYDGYTSVDEHKRPVMHFTNEEVHRSFEILRLHHYFTRSCVDWWIRVNKRGSVSGGLRKYNFDDLKHLDSNEVSDKTAVSVASHLRTIIQWDGIGWQKKYFPLSNVVPQECEKSSHWKAEVN